MCETQSNGVECTAAAKWAWAEPGGFGVHYVCDDCRRAVQEYYGPAVEFTPLAFRPRDRRGVSGWVEVAGLFVVVAVVYLAAMVFVL